MIKEASRTKRILAVSFGVALGASAIAAVPASSPVARQQQQPGQTAARPPADELKEAQKVEAAADAAARLKAAGEFLRKYPKSTLREQVALLVAQKIEATPDKAQQITHAESFMAVFTEPAEADIIRPFIIDAYTAADRHADAFRVAADYLSRHPDDVNMQTNMALIGIEQAKRGKAEFVEQSRQYGLKAVEMIEADKRPATFDDARWAEFKTKWLPQLYQSLGVLSYMGQNFPEAVTRLEKASMLNPADAFSYALLGSIYNADYQKLAEQYNAAPAGPAKEDLLKKSQAQMDKVIDVYARAAALSEGNPQFKQLRDQVMVDLETYYKFRNKNSTEGLQQLIDKHKAPKQQ
ncbi:MAG: hypothetical protein ACRD9R_00170 [Pyrinomonadaceae bacterium]